jgi:alkylated DNA nucleotide flippase Atl1
VLKLGDLGDLDPRPPESGLELFISEALAKFLTRLAAAAQELAEELHGAPELVPDDDRGAPSGLGSRQAQTFAVLAGAPDEGLSTAEIAKAMNGYDVPNAYLTLRRLEQMDIAELIPGSKPQRWRLHPKHRSNAGPYLLAAQQVRQGEWTTYGEISIAVKGDIQGARAVGRAAATLPDFPAPHRVLNKGGVVPPQWHSEGGGGPEECEQRLAAEGVTFVDGHADPARRVLHTGLVKYVSSESAGPGRTDEHR